MPSETRTKRKWSLASVALQDAFTDFYLSRQAMNCTPATMEFYHFTAGIFLQWLEGRGVTTPDEVSARHVRKYLAGLAGKDTTRQAHPRAIKTMLRFWYAEKYIPKAITFDMPRLSKKKLPRLTAEELKTVVIACNVRDKAIVLFMADSGLRRAEVVNLNWGDVNILNGLVRVLHGKGRKFRSAAIGAKTRRCYSRIVERLKTIQTVTLCSRPGPENGLKVPLYCLSLEDCQRERGYIARLTPCEELIQSLPFALAGMRYTFKGS